MQFLPVYNRLTEEALENAIDVYFGNTPTRVISAEYLAAIMLETGRPKDRSRLIHFFEFEVLDKTVFEDIVQRHGLGDGWKALKKYFLEKED